MTFKKESFYDKIRFMIAIKYILLIKKEEGTTS